MQQWAYETFDGDNIPMCEFIMLKLPEGYNGFFLHMDHRLIDSCGLVVMIEDLIPIIYALQIWNSLPAGAGRF